MMNWCSLPIARAYAFALYVDQDMVASIGRQQGSTAAAARLVDTKLSSPACGDTAIVLKMARDIDGEHLSHGFFNSVSARWAKRVGAASAPTQANQPKQALDDSSSPLAQIRALADQFNGLKLAMGDEVVFRWHRDGTLHTTVQGGITPPRSFVVDDPDVIAALFAVYTGEGAVSEEGRATFDANLADMASQPPAEGADVSTLLRPVVRRHVSER